MVQALNTKAILTLASLFKRPGLAVPHVSVSNVSSIDFEALQRYAGIQAIVYDKDNTLTAPYDLDLHPAAVDGLEQSIQVFGKDKVAILSNSAGTLDDPHYQDALAIEKKLGIAVIRHTEKKPGGIQEVLQHFQIEDASSIAVVGDRILTDIVFGNLHGMLTVHTLPLVSGKQNKKDNWTAKLIRPMENRIIYGNLFEGYFRRKMLPHSKWRGPTEHPLVR